MYVNFQCSYCNHTKLQRVRCFTVVTEIVLQVSKRSLSLAPVNITGGNAPTYACGQCGASVIKNNQPVTEIKDLFEVLQAMNMLSETECQTTTGK